MIRKITWIVFIALLALSIFRDISNNTLAVAVMLLLLTLFTDLKEFNFWGLRGTKDDVLKDTNLEDLEKQKALPKNAKQTLKVKKAVGKLPPQQMEMSLMDTDKGNFLALAFELERLLRLFATASGDETVTPTTPLTALMERLRASELITDEGHQQMQIITSIRDLLVHGRDDELSEESLSATTKIAYNLYQELFLLLYGEEKKD
jgi:hypothetical protein